MADVYFSVWELERVQYIEREPYRPLLFAKLSIYGKCRLTLASQAGMSRMMGNLLLFE